MSVDRFLTHLIDLRPRFECEPAGPMQDTRIEIELSHLLRPSADALALTELRSLLSVRSPDIEALYGEHDGMDLYVQGRTVGLALYPISAWRAATDGFRQDVESSGRAIDELYPFEREGIVVGEAPQSGNVLMIYEGRMHYSDHDGGDDTPIAENFGAFLGRLVDDPAKFLYDLGCYARYSDGQSDRQWIPLRYLHD